jgi:predicted aspartyl protease
MELGGYPDRREEAEGSLTANRRLDAECGDLLAGGTDAISMTSHRAIRSFLPALAVVFALLTPGDAGAASPGKCTLARIAEWRVTSASSTPIVDGTINGQKVSIMIDTGATRSIIVRAAADRLGLVRYDAPGQRMIGIGGESKVEAVSIDELTIGTDVRRNWRILVAGEHDFGADIAVVLGEDFFYQAEVEFDLPHNAVRLFQARDCGGASLAYWTTEGAGVVGIDAIFEANPRIELTVEINGRPVKTMLDSGASSSVVTKSQAAALGVTPESAGVVVGCSVGLGQKTVEFWRGPFESFRIGDELIRDPTIRFADIWRFSTYRSASLISRRSVAAPDMLLGADFLRSHRVLVAHSQRKMYFTYAGGTVFPVQSFRSCDDIERQEAAKRQAPAAK